MGNNWKDILGSIAPVLILNQFHCWEYRDILINCPDISNGANYVKTFGFNRSTYRPFGCSRANKVKSWWAYLAHCLRLWKRDREACRGIPFWRRSKLWLSSCGSEPIARIQKFQTRRGTFAQDSRIPYLVWHERAMSKQKESQLRKLWRAWDNGLRTMALQLRKLSARHGAASQQRTQPRQKRPEWQLRAEQLSLGDPINATIEPPQYNILFIVGEKNSSSRYSSSWKFSSKRPLQIYSGTPIFGGQL